MVSEYLKVVYFVRQGESGPVKIGTTALASLDGRLKQLQTGSPYSLQLLGVIEGGDELEERLHERFATCRLEGEWFSASEELVQFVRLNARQPDDLKGDSAARAERRGSVGRDDRSPGTRSISARSLSPLESKLILRLESEKQLVVTVAQAMDILDCSYDHVRQVLRRLARRHWLAPITPGTYELIPAERGEHAVPDTNPFFIGSTLVEPYHFSFATAAFFHGLSTQASAIVFIATTVRKKRRLLEVRGRDYRLVAQSRRKFFGAVEVDAYGTCVMMAEPEKTVVDSLDRPAYAGDVPEVAAMLWHGRGRLDWDRLVDHALRFGSQALVQRLGYLADFLQLSLGEAVRTRLLDAVGKSTPYLGRRSRWGIGGDYDATWHIVDNVPRRVLLSEIEVF